MFDLFYILELVVCVSMLLLGILMASSYVPDGKEMQSYRKGHNLVIAGYLLLGSSMLYLLVKHPTYQEQVMTRVIQYLMPAESFFLMLALVYAMSDKPRIQQFARWAFWSTFIVLTLAFMLNEIYGGVYSGIVKYGLPVVMSVLYIVYTRVFIRLFRWWKKRVPLQKERHRAVILLWLILLIFALFALFVTFYPSPEVHLAFTFFYLFVLIMFAIVYHNLGVLISLNRTENSNAPQQTISDRKSETPVVQTIKALHQKTEELHVAETRDNINSNAAVLESASKPERENQLSESMRSRLNEWIEQKEYLKRGITMQELSKILGTNRTYLSTYINDTYGMNFNAWINSMRIREAQTLMTTHPEWSLFLIAEKTGFTDLSQFSKIFKASVGFSPNNWRKSEFETKQV